MKRHHHLQGPESKQWAVVVEDNGQFTIDYPSYNCGSNTAEIIFPDVTTARTYLAGKWNIAPRTIALVHTDEFDLTADERIIKLARQLARGIILTTEFLGQMDIIIAEESIQAGENK